MTCCQDRRMAARQSHAGARSAAPSSIPNRAARPAPALFEYVGQRALQVTGPATGVIYRFTRSGARVSIHGADAAALSSIPGLRPAR
jgi:hypothetical protein